MYKEQSSTATQLAESFQQLLVKHAEAEKMLAKERATRIKLQKQAAASATPGQAAASTVAAARLPAVAVSCDGTDGSGSGALVGGEGSQTALASAVCERDLSSEAAGEILSLRKQLHDERGRSAEVARQLQEARKKSSDAANELDQLRLQFRLQLEQSAVELKEERAKAEKASRQLHEERASRGGSVVSGDQSPGAAQTFAMDQMQRQFQQAQSGLAASKASCDGLRRKLEAADREIMRLRQASMVTAVAPTISLTPAVGATREEVESLRKSLQAAKAQVASQATASAAAARAMEGRLREVEEARKSVVLRCERAEKAREGALSETAAANMRAESLQVRLSQIYMLRTIWGGPIWVMYWMVWMVWMG